MNIEGPRKLAVNYFLFLYRCNAHVGYSLPDPNMATTPMLQVAEAKHFVPTYAKFKRFGSL
jgi:hypothetical protein